MLDLMLTAVQLSLSTILMMAIVGATSVAIFGIVYFTMAWAFFWHDKVQDLMSFKSSQSDQTSVSVSL